MSMEFKKNTFCKLNNVIFLILFSLSFAQLPNLLSEEENNELLQSCGSLTDEEEIRRRRSTENDFLSVFGDKALSANFPWVVHLHYSFRGDTGDCAGTLISNRHILTAAHCFFRYLCGNRASREKRLKFIRRPQFWSVYYAGECPPIYDNKCSPGEKAIEISVTQIFVPKDFIDTQCNNSDIAIVETSEDVYPIVEHFPCIASEGDKIPAYVTLCGFAGNPVTGIRKMSLKTVDLTLTECKYKGKDIICTSEKKSNVCKGDSGGGMTYNAEDGKVYIGGVMSYGTDCFEIYKTFKKAKESGNKMVLDKLTGSAFTDVRKFGNFICENTGICRDGKPKLNDDSKTYTIIPN